MRGAALILRTQRPLLRRFRVRVLPQVSSLSTPKLVGDYPKISEIALKKNNLFMVTYLKIIIPKPL